MLEQVIGHESFRPLNTKLVSSDAVFFESSVGRKLVGQDRAIRELSKRFVIARSGVGRPGQPLGVLLFLGPTGTGKTRVVEAACETLFGSANHFIKIDCAEFQHNGDTAKLIGAPPGFLGHRETPPRFSQALIDELQTPVDQFTFILFDEIEKACEMMHDMMLGILDKARLTLSDNTVVNFEKTIIVLTSNLGSKDIANLVGGGIGMAPAASSRMSGSKVDQQIYKTAKAAAERRFSPEFMNRIDKLVVFRSLKPAHYREMLQIELDRVTRRLQANYYNVRFDIRLTEGACRFILDEGYDARYGGRHLRRAVERFIVDPVMPLIASGQLVDGETLYIGCNGEGELAYAAAAGEYSAREISLVN